MFPRKVVEKIKTHFVLNIFFRRSYRLWENVKKYSRAGQATDVNTVHVQCILCKVKVKVTPVQALGLCTGRAAHRGE